MLFKYERGTSTLKSNKNSQSILWFFNKVNILRINTKLSHHKKINWAHHYASIVNETLWLLLLKVSKDNFIMFKIAILCFYSQVTIQYFYNNLLNYLQQITSTSILNSSQLRTYYRDFIRIFLYLKQKRIIKDLN